MLINFAVGDPMDFIFIGVINLQRWKGVLKYIWDQADAGQLDKGDVEHWVYVL